MRAFVPFLDITRIGSVTVAVVCKHDFPVSDFFKLTFIVTSFEYQLYFCIPEFFLLSFFLLVDMKTLERKTIDYRRVRKIRNRWHLFVTLHNNPSLREHRRSELFVERSAFAAFGIMVQRGVVQFSDITIDREGDEKFDTNL